MEGVQVSRIEKGFVLPNGYTWDAKLGNGKKEGKVIVRDQYGCLSHVLFYEDDKLNGLCEFYKLGMIKEKHTFVNDVAEGWGCEIKFGEVVKWFFDTDGIREVELTKSTVLENYWRAVSTTSKEVISLCKYDENHKRIDKGYIFEGDRIKRIVFFEDGKVRDVLKSFEGDQMTEYDSNGYRVYQGCFIDDLSKDYPREGEGIEFAREDCIEVVTYVGGWKNNKRDGYGYTLKDGIAELEGSWKDGLPNGLCLLNHDGNVYKGDWVMGELNNSEDDAFCYVNGQIKRIEPKIIDNENHLKELLNDEVQKRSVKKLVIAEGCGNEMKADLELCGFENLESIVVKKNSLKNLNSLKISDNPVLERIETENGSGGYSDSSRNTGAFYYVKSVTITSTLIYD